MNTYISIKERRHIYDDEIRAHYADTPTQELADRLGLNYWTLSRRAKRLGVKKSKEFMRLSSGKAQHNAYIVLTEDRMQYIRQHFHDTPSLEIARHLGIDESTVKRFARKDGLKKDSEYLRIMRDKGRANRWNTCIRCVTNVTERDISTS